MLRWGSSSSPTRQFAILSLLTIGVSTLVAGLALAHFVEQAILEREWTSTAAFLRAAARDHLRPDDFGTGRRVPPPASQDRLEEFTRQVRRLPEVLRLVVYGPDGEPLWTDAEGAFRPHGSTPAVRAALAGRTEATFEPGRATGGERVELYVPIAFPGEGRVAGAVEAYVDASRVSASVGRARTILWALAAGSGGLLYVALYGIVWRASRTLETQHVALARRAEELARANAELRALQDQLVAAERLAAFGEVTAAVAHGLGNPLAAIRASAQVALLDAVGPQRETLLRIVTDTDRLRARMRALLDLGRPVDAQAGAHRARRGDPGGAGSRAPAERCPRRPGRRRRPRGSPEGAPRPGPVRGGAPLPDRQRARCDAFRRRAAARRGGRGRGRPAPDRGHRPRDLPEALTRAFQPFFTTKPDGTGLGLPLAKKLLEATGARLSVESDGSGTRVAITLPQAGA